ncbi:TonB-dependent receptor [Sphingobacterium suaedae]|uniref:TonB-dependent receptor n=1 Tax=Sphingobacterium suaedae TaxID=1686402 RepID=A0ABW5KL83_9SPHI
MIFIQQNDYGLDRSGAHTKRWILHMKLTILLTVLSVFKIYASGFAQQISVKAVNLPLVSVMRSVQKQSGMPFLLNGKDIATTRMTADIKQLPLEKALTVLFKDKAISWEISDGTIILRRITHGPASANTLLAKQERNIHGTVTDEQGSPIQGASVLVPGTTKGTTTDAQGHFSITLNPSEDILLVSYVGYFKAEIRVGNREVLPVVLKATSGDLDEVVVIGYGTQKKKLTTGASVQVKGEDLQKLSTSSVMGALQSQAPGVQITQSSGMPGENFKVTIRGLGTIGNSSPLYVIDGIPGGDINTLNPSDIESVDILKDAASAAIYGSRAANGVVLVTTKQGKAGKLSFSYDAFVGWQNPYRLPSLLNAKEYMTIQNEIRFNEGQAPYDWATIIPKQYQQIMDGTWNGTNWLKEIQNDNALTQNHAINLNGGNEQSRFTLGYSFSEQDGIFGKPVQPNSKRHNFRLNSEHVLLKNDDFNVITIGENLTYSYTKESGIGIGNIYWNDIHNMLIGNPLMPVLNEAGGYYDQASKIADGWSLDGATANPIADMVYRRGQNISNSHALFANASVEIQPIENLKFKSTFGYKMNASSYRQYTPIFTLSTTNSNPQDDVQQNHGNGYSTTFQNTLSYLWQVGGGHHFDAVVGQSIEKWGMGSDLSATNSNSIFPGSWKNAWITNTKGVAEGLTILSGAPWPEGSLASFFGRLNYNFNETYMATLIFRADGSSNFAPDNRWGYFPSVAAGWVVSNESFMENTQNWLDFFKLRASWGQNGNQAIDSWQYLATVAFDTQNGYYFGNNKGSLQTGGYPDILPNSDIKWETSEQLDIGFDARFANNRLAWTFDWYKKTTKDWLVVAPTLAIHGTNAPFINGGDVENQGVELGLTWNDQINDFRYGVSLNGAYNKNEIKKIANSEGIIHGQENVLSQGTTEMYRAQVGYPIGYFYGYQTGGIFQNQEQIEAYKNQGLGVLSTAQPGDVIFVDRNGDGAITNDDKIMIGNPHPDFTGGLNLTVGYKGLDLGVTAFGAFGHQIAKSYRSFADSPLQNFTTEVFQRWHGEGTSNRYPRLTMGAHTNNQYISDIYIEDADFVKIQNITLGYDLKSCFPKIPFGQARIYFTAQNLYTFTGYSGMDPEIGYGYDESWVSGIDLGFYPSPRTYLVGLNLKF